MVIESSSRTRPSLAQTIIVADGSRQLVRTAHSTSQDRSIGGVLVPRSFRDSQSVWDLRPSGSGASPSRGVKSPHDRWTKAAFEGEVVRVVRRNRDDVTRGRRGRNPEKEEVRDDQTAGVRD